MILLVIDSIIESINESESNIIVIMCIIIDRNIVSIIIVYYYNINVILFNIILFYDYYCYSNWYLIFLKGNDRINGSNVIIILMIPINMIFSID